MVQLIARSSLLGVIVVLASACGGAAGAAGPTSVAGCDGPGLTLARAYGADAHASGAYAITAAQLAAWQERPHFGGTSYLVRSPWRDLPATAQVSFCYYDGTFTNFDHGPAGIGAPGTPATAVAPYDRLLVAVDSTGKASILSIGPSAKMSIQDPTK